MEFEGKEREGAKGPSLHPEAALLGCLCLPLVTRPSKVGLCSEGQGHRSHNMTSKGSTLHVLVGPILSEGMFPEGLQVGPQLCPPQGTGSLWISWKT